MKYHEIRKPFGWWMLLAPLLFAACAAPAGTQSAAGADVAGLVQARRFVFVPQTVNPVGGRTRQLTGEFFLRVTPDTLQSYLPYFGRAYSAPVRPGQSAMDFTVTQFEVQVAPGRKGSQTITLRPREGTDVREMILQVFPNGNASLQALSNNRQAISYNGSIREGRK